jgi:hypothetical protein
VDKDDTPDSPPESEKPKLRFSTVPSDGKLPNHFNHAQEYLAKRGIDQALCDKLGFKIMPAAQWFTETYPGSKSKDVRISIVFPHLNYKGEDTGWNSVKFIRTRTQGATFVQDSRPTRSSKKGELIHAYLCPLKNWRNLQKGQRIYICESVIKAVNVALLGFHAVGLNGVAAFASAKKGVDLLTEIKDLPWQRLELQPVIMYDSDHEKYDITRAYETLANKLVNLCKSPLPVYLPLQKREDGEDWGFDDARHQLGDKWALEFLSGEGGVIPLDPIRQALHDTNDMFIVVRGVSAIVELKTGNIMTESKFRTVNYANKIEWTDDGKAIQIAKSWLQWKDRHECEGIEYMPGGGQIHNDSYNAWKGMGTEPVKGDVTPWLDIINNNIRSEKERKYLIQWCAYPVQNLGAKLHTSVVLVGVQGIGKSLLARSLGMVYGNNNYKEVDRGDITGSFNAFWTQSQLVVVEEMRGEHKTADKAFMGRLKKIITSDQYIVKKKHVQEYNITNHVNFLFTTNDADSFSFEGDDRRFFVAHFEPVVDYYRDTGYWNRFVAWLNGDGVAALHHYLLNVDMEGFDPGEPAPETEYKKVMEEAAYSGPEAWINLLLSDAREMLGSERALWKSRELAEVYYEGDVHSGPAAAKAFSNYMLNRGFVMANTNTNIGNRKMGKAKYWIVQDRDNPLWHDHGYCVVHLLEHLAELAPDSKY